MRRRAARKDREPTTALINIVFLMLIFFLVAGTLAPPLDKGLALVRTADIEGTAPADALVVHSDGRMTRGGVAVLSPAAFVDALPEDARGRIRIVPDRDLPAGTLVSIGNALRAAGAESVAIVTERGLE
ncbi:biopolymer transport protein ExbD [Lutimaribacter pacificus]|uniref:Biopolymer transport protein ExbD n=1 Tax=Lutimaribacter pacificus TaxID=391948 RepID=A0A1H0D5B3_9RHOB|nr:biopolymer transporter ExbD [Lutimaribacter pacificus]SDN65266.1 biopolymer transport protein ExbD [Lutimaribacter pacificus]SHJ36749.1 biopolymer transport protein ExbD [Lutimaribacter pacificus]